MKTTSQRLLQMLTEQTEIPVLLWRGKLWEQAPHVPAPPYRGGLLDMHIGQDAGLLLCWEHPAQAGGLLLASVGIPFGASLFSLPDMRPPVVLGTFFTWMAEGPSGTIVQVLDAQDGAELAGEHAPAPRLGADSCWKGIRCWFPLPAGAEGLFLTLAIALPQEEPLAVHLLWNCWRRLASLARRATLPCLDEQEAP